MRRGISVLLFPIATVALPGSPAGAAPLVEPHLGGTVFVGPTSPHVTAIFWNPAAAGLMRGLHLYVSGVGRLDATTVARAPVDPADGEPTAGGAGAITYPEVSTTGLSPGGFIGLSMDLSTAITLGIATYTPIAERQPADREPLRYHTLGSSFYSWYSTLSVSFRPATPVLVGAGVSLVFTSIDLRFAVDEAIAGCAETPCGAEDPAAAQRYRLESGFFADGPSFAWNLGIMLKLSPRLWVGGAYISEPGTAQQDLQATGTALVTPAPRDAQSDASGRAEIHYRLPAMVHLGARYELVPETWYLVGGLRWILLGRLELYDLRLSGPALRAAQVPEWMLRYRGFQDVLSVDAGLEHPAGRSVRLGTRVRFETSAVPLEAVAPSQVDGPKLELAGGTELRLGGGWSVSLGASAAYMFPREVGDSAFSPREQIDCVASGHDLDRCEAAREGRAISTAAGAYDRTTFGFVLGLSYDRL